MSKKIIEIGSDEDGETYYIVGNVTRLGALRALHKYIKDNIGELDEMPTQDDLTQTNFRETVDCPHGGEHQGYTWWGTPKPDEKTKPLGIGWIWQI